MNYENRITVHHVNDKHVVADLHLYCGRNGSKYPHLIDAKLGNIHWMRAEPQRDAVCEAFASDLSDTSHPYWPSIKRMAQRLAEGRTIALYCHCAPKRCHCDTLRLAAIESV